MNKIAVAIVLAASALAAVAAETEGKKPERKQLPPGKLRQLVMERSGGFIRDTRAQKGKVVIVNAQKAVGEAPIRALAAEFSADAKINIEVVGGAFDIKKPDVKGEVCVFVVDDPALPPSLLATERRWGVVNAPAFKSDKPAFYEARVRKEIVRVMGLLLGAADSQFPLSLTGHFGKPEDLDQVPQSKLPHDVMMRIGMAAPKIGITTWKRTTYKKACEEGWAPAPTNQYQKAIWDATLKLPEKPMTIEFDPKKDK